MKTVAGLVPFTTIDFPGRLAAVIFLQGCPLRCPFCHNPLLQNSEEQGPLSYQDVEEFLIQRKGRLDGIVLSGGEPLMQESVLNLAQRIKDEGFSLGIHTSGVYPKRLQEMLPLIDWVGLDIKAPWHKYELLTGRKGVETLVQESLSLLLTHQIPFEARTTCDPRYLTIDDISEIADSLFNAKVENYVLQKYRTFKEDRNPPEMSAIDSFFQDQKLQQKLNTLFPKRQKDRC